MLLQQVFALEALDDFVLVWVAQNLLNQTRGEDQIFFTFTIRRRAFDLHIINVFANRQRGLLNREALQRIKKGAILVNVARAQVIEREALMEALEDGRLGGFALDVGYDEPAKLGEPLLKYKNVILVPHTAPAHRHNALSDWEEMFVKMSSIFTGVRNRTSAPL